MRTTNQALRKCGGQHRRLPLQRFNDSTLQRSPMISSRFNDSTNPWPAKALATAARGDSQPYTNGGSSTSKVVAAFTSQADRIFLVAIEVLICGHCEHPG